MKDRECEDCGELIGEKRLQAKPTAVLCINCQYEAEKMGLFRTHRMDVQASVKCGQIDGLVPVFHRWTTN